MTKKHQARACGVLLSSGGAVAGGEVGSKFGYAIGEKVYEVVGD